MQKRIEEETGVVYKANTAEHSPRGSILKNLRASSKSKKSLKINLEILKSKGGKFSSKNSILREKNGPAENEAAMMVLENNND